MPTSAALSFSPRIRFEITAQTVAERFSAQYGDEPSCINPRGNAGWQMLVYVRNRPGLNTVTTSVSGVRQMMRELRAGRAIGLLPDHVPPEGQGVGTFLAAPPTALATPVANWHNNRVRRCWSSGASACPPRVVLCRTASL